MTPISRIKFVGVLLPLALLFGCARFNLPFNTSYRLLVAMSGSNSARIYSTNSTTGALTFVSALSITSPTKVVAHPTSGAFWIYKNNSSLECYQYNFRTGTGPTFGSSTTISGTIDQISAANDGSSLTYSKTGNANLFWRTVSDCSVGGENSVSAPGKTASVYFSEDSSGSTVAVMEGSANRIWKFSRASDATLTLSGTYTGGTGGSPPSITPDGNFLVFSKANDVSVLNLSTMSIVQTVAAGTSMNRFYDLVEHPCTWATSRRHASSHHDQFKWDPLGRYRRRSRHHRL